MNRNFRAWWYAGRRISRRALIAILIVSLVLPGLSGFGLRIAAAQEEDGEPFADRMARLTGHLKKQFEESERLEGQIKENLAGLGFRV